MLNHTCLSIEYVYFFTLKIFQRWQGNYTCTAWNGIGGQKKAIAAITVHCEFSHCISNHCSCEKKVFYRTFVYMKVNNSTE